MSKPISIPLALWVPLASSVALGVPGVIALLTHHLVLFASLAPTSVMITQQPMLASTRPYNSIVGHMIGLGSGFFAVWVLGIASQPSVFTLHMVSGARVCAAMISIATALEAELLLDARHPPAASTTLLAALGSFRVDWTSTWEVLVGVIAVTAAGEILRIFHPAPQPPDSRPSPAAQRARALRRLGLRASAGS
ncbi:MAG TPA: HPP family protein [Steroidobacteraceae bacterium]|nr:HPP family protein [Steroidobacteraceae bacterium]